MNYLSYLCRHYEEYIRKHSKDSAAITSWRSNTLLDVSRNRLRTCRTHPASRDELDVDVAVVPLWHNGSGVPRMALETDAGTYWRETQNEYEYLLYIHFVRIVTCHTANRRIYALRHTETI